jgi:hypothetical protein
LKRSKKGARRGPVMITIAPRRDELRLKGRRDEMRLKRRRDEAEQMSTRGARGDMG